MDTEKRFAAGEMADFGMVPPSRRMSVQSYVSGGAPPREVARKRSPKRHSPTRYTNDRSAAMSSLNSSLTFSEITSSRDDDASEFSDIINPFMEASVDHQPGMPQRRRSESTLSIDSSSNNSALSSFNRSSNLLQAFVLPLAGGDDATPTRPSRQQSVADGSSSHGGDIHHHQEFDNDDDRDLMNMLKNSYDSHGEKLPALVSHRSSTSTTDSMEPYLDCLEQDFASALDARVGQLSKSAAQFRTIVQIKDRKYGIRSYKKCFVGSEAVDAMLQAGLASTRTEAVELGRAYMTYIGLFKHVCDSHMFKDKYLFYRFTATPTKDTNSTGKGSLARPEDQSSSSGSGISGDDGYVNSLIRTSIRRQSRRKSRHSAPWYALGQRFTIKEDEVMED